MFAEPAHLLCLALRLSLGVERENAPGSRASMGCRSQRVFYGFSLFCRLQPGSRPSRLEGGRGAAAAITREARPSRTPRELGASSALKIDRDVQLKRRANAIVIVDAFGSSFYVAPRTATRCETRGQGVFVAVVVITVVKTAAFSYIDRIRSGGKRNRLL